MKKAIKEEILSKLIDGCVLRIARKSFVCQGDGTPDLKERKFSYLCLHTIVPRIKYVEFEPPQQPSAWTRHCLQCAELYLARKAEFKVGERVYWKSSDGREFYAVIRARHPHADCSDCYALEAVYASNCLDMPDNWAHARDLRKA